jgi:PHP family Zn ribbon phosphoesterase
MHPSAIVQEALAQSLDIIGISDHNASENVRHVMAAAVGKELVVIPGMEACTKEEVHILALFENLDALSSLQEIVYSRLKGLNDEDAFGFQAIVNEAGEVEGFNEHLLIGATEISLSEMVDLVHSLDGLAIASHIDRPAFGILGQLGFMPPDLPFDALEISANMSIPQARQQYSELRSFPFITSSDAHFPADIGRTCTRMYLESPSFREIRLALQKQEGRYILE